ncbi:hypothetical protein GIB67_019810 [Kingdonia uniflora]|uniref:Uncharacterized protein n=1 Tax=Kingdonia uniflora TaxID=39325 RepID=A0A7J7MKF6_9MAGN|nr:hypothetical protein GIB67_019810 [Kingdonia uniflora]
MKEKLVSPLKIHRKPNSKKNDDLEIGDPNERLTVLETTVSALTSIVGELVEQLCFMSLAKASTSVERRGRSKKKGVMEAIAIEGKYLKSDKEDDKVKSGYKSSWKNEHKGEAKGEETSYKEFHCNHCKASGHLSDYCWKLHPELRPKEEKCNKEKYALAAEVQQEDWKTCCFNQAIGFVQIVALRIHNGYSDLSSSFLSTRILEDANNPEKSLILSRETNWLKSRGFSTKLITKSCASSESLLFTFQLERDV